MKRANIIILAAVCCLAVAPGLVIAAAPAKKPAAKKAYSKPSAASIRDRYIEMLITQNILIDSCEAAASHIKLVSSADSIERGISSNNKVKFTDLGFEKDEYETTDQYSARVAGQLHVFFGEPGKVVFKATVPDDLVSYNADLGLMAIQLENRASYESVYTPAHLKLPVFDEEEKVGVRHGQTAMGIKFDYELWTAYKRTIDVSFPFNGTNVGDPFEISVPPAEAKQLRENLTLLAFGDVTSPYMTSEDDEDVASLDDPVYLITREEIYYARPSCLIVFNAKSGEIYKTFKAQLDTQPSSN